MYVHCMGRLQTFSEKFFVYAVYIVYKRRLQTFFGGARALSAQDARGTLSKLILYGTLPENSVEFVREFAAVQTHT